MGYASYFLGIAAEASVKKEMISGPIQQTAPFVLSTYKKVKHEAWGLLHGSYPVGKYLSYYIPTVGGDQNDPSVLHTQ